MRLDGQPEGEKGVKMDGLELIGTYIFSALVGASESVLRVAILGWASAFPESRFRWHLQRVSISSVSLQIYRQSSNKRTHKI